MLPRLAEILRVLALTALAAACGREPPPVLPLAPLPLTGSAPYRLDSGDTVRIVVAGEPELTNTYQLDASGAFAMPLIGSIAARGMMPDELRNRIVARLRDGYIRRPDVSIEVVAYRPLYVTGRVAAPGQHEYLAGMNALQAVAAAGGSIDPVGGIVEVSRIVDATIFTGTIASTQPVLPGDMIVVR